MLESAPELRCRWYCYEPRRVFVEEVRWALGGEESDLKNDRHSPYEVRPPTKIWCRAWLRHPDLRCIFLGRVLRVSTAVMD